MRGGECSWREGGGGGADRSEGSDRSEGAAAEFCFQGRGVAVFHKGRRMVTLSC